MNGRQLFATALSCLIIGNAFAQEQDDPYALTQTQINNMYRTQTKTRVSVHDPSVVYSNGTYHIYGSHRAHATSKDLQNWSGAREDIYGIVNASGTVVRTGYTNCFSAQQVKRVKALVNGAVTEVDFADGNGNPFDAKAWSCAVPADNGAAWTIDGNMWAPDIIYNEALGKWCFYLSLNGNKWNSVIVLMTADDIEGPYVYQGPVVYSGFLNATNAAINWHLTDMDLVLGQQETLPSRYNRGGDWPNYWLNSIDPCVFYDEDGELWMTYGSWFGGIFALRLDKETGLRDYTVTYPVANDGGGRPTSDPYFGKRIAGGYYVSGEGSYVQRIGNYYFLFITNGGLDAKGGYSMRVFRSSNPDGPYVDASGKSAVYSGWQKNYAADETALCGNLLIGAYNHLGFQTLGELAQGHNSAIVDDMGRAFVIYHTRFNNGTEGHQVRVHQLLTNEDGWIVALPFEFNGEEWTDEDVRTKEYDPASLVGEFTLIRHNYRLDCAALEVAEPLTVQLTADGRVTGALTGTWKQTPGTSYITITAGGTTYKGVIATQHMDGTTMEAITFSALSTSGTVLWGYRVSPAHAIAYTVKNTTSPLTDNQRISENTDLAVTTYFGTACEWVSSNPDVFSNDGKYNPAETQTDIVMTQRFVNAPYHYDRTYNLRIQPAGDVNTGYLDGLVAYYDFDAKPTINYYDDSQRAYYGSQSSGTTPTLEENSARFGQVARVVGGTDKAKTCGYIRFPNPLQGQTDMEGFTVSMWVRRETNDKWGSLWAFTKSAPQLASDQPRFFLTENAHVGFTNLADTFALNYPSAVRTDIPTGKWSFVTITVSPTEMNFYVNGSQRSKTGFMSTAGRRYADFDYQKVIDVVAEAQYFTIGMGNRVATAAALYDDLLISNRPYTLDEVRNLYSAATRVTDFTAGATPVLSPEADAALQRTGIYDMTGRRLDRITAPGIYIVNGRKVRVAQ